MAAQWYVQVMGEVTGPFTSSQLREEAREGRVTRDALVRKGDDGEWILIDRINGLFDESGQPVKRGRPGARKQSRPAGDEPRANGRGRRHSLVDDEEEDDAEEAELVVDQRPPWFKKRYLSSTAVVLGVACWLGYSWLSATQENLAIEEEFQEPALQEFESVEEEMQFFGTRLKNMGATSESLNEQVTRSMGIVPPTPKPEIDAFRQALEKSELELKVNYTEGITDDTALALIDEYIDLIVEMEKARDGLAELKHNNPSVYKIKIYIEALNRVQTATISSCVGLYKLARSKEEKQAAQG